MNDNLNNNNIQYDPNTGQPLYNNQQPIYNNAQPNQPNVNYATGVNQFVEPQPQKKKSKALIIVISVILGLVILGVAIFVLVFASSNKLVCTSAEGNITIMYNDSAITGYSANGIIYNLEQQQLAAEQVGMDSYLSAFTTWFETNTSGTCTIEKK